MTNRKNGRASLLSHRINYRVSALPARATTTAATVAAASAARATPARSAIATAITAWRAAAFAAIEVGLVGGFVSTLESDWNRSTLSAFCTFGRGFSAAHLGALLFQDGLARQLDAVAFDCQHLHQDLVAFFQFVTNIVDAMLGDFADVQQAVCAGNDFDERSEVGQARHRAQICLTHFGGCRDVSDHPQGLGRGFLIARRHIHLAGVFDVDLDARLLDDAANDLASRPD